MNNDGRSSLSELCDTMIKCRQHSRGGVVDSMFWRASYVVVRTDRLCRLRQKIVILLLKAAAHSARPFSFSRMAASVADNLACEVNLLKRNIRKCYGTALQSLSSNLNPAALFHKERRVPARVGVCHHRRNHRPF